MSVSELSTSTQNYLKAIWSLTEWSDQPVTASLIADRAGMKLSSTSDAIRRLDKQGMLTHAPYGAVELTKEGTANALAMVRRHRLIETFLVQVLGYTWDQVHDEAEVLEHAVSDLMVERIDALLEHPERDPHGDPIPAADGRLHAPDARRLTEVGPGTTVIVERISDEDPELLQFFGQRGIGIGTVLRVEPGPPYSEAFDVRTLDASAADGHESDGHHEGAAASAALGRAATDALFVSETQ